MKVDVTFVPAEVTAELIVAKAAVIIDVLRASTTIITALGNGAAAIIPCTEIEEAQHLARSRVGENILLCGEEQTERFCPKLATIIPNSIRNVFIVYGFYSK